MTMDLHADQIQGFFDFPVDHIYASSIFVPYLKSLNMEDLVIASPDMGGSKRANAYSRFMHCDMVICYKQRSKANSVDKMMLIGDVRDKNVIIVDDMIDTGGTITMAANMMMEEGALSVRCAATHPVLSGPAYELIEKSMITDLVVTDSIPLKQESPKIIVLPIADVFADVINKVYNYQSISSTFIV
jgi:ribose-phosphate pyrophosphokinase